MTLLLALTVLLLDVRLGCADIWVDACRVPAKWTSSALLRAPVYVGGLHI